ncbi:MAG TPA: hypothetical protein VOB72_05835 [Candidatus Dormibacteraeota bacterium]|nr:hypothetical protein [Candidatus Dormibacteraeota bacterium]
MRGRIQVGGGELGAGAERVSRLLDGMLAQIGRPAAELAEPERARTTPRALRHEVAEAEPDRAVIRRMPDRRTRWSRPWPRWPPPPPG